ncbi:hypothetical protein GCL60_16480 [Silvanigrella paludirubra]|uniref:Phage tail collar domain-containing protein n=1 Tax=Silvanigrella paludirubra TaxID=2499159 RepID=A0A6N6VRL5_9BACT|nr:hypothetical protein [Silvanigrella paludirubra]KAB8035825.1 hypothetical protein GCL60_16480 [Silvanigrella paludirubra]
MKSIELSNINDVNKLEETVKKIIGVPLGAAISTFPSLGGYKCEALEIADSYGFVLCNGQEIKDKDSIFFGKKIPNLNNNLFLKGSLQDNTTQGNKDHKADFDHTHIYSHTHKYCEYQIKINESQKVLEQYFYTTADKNEQPNQNIVFQYSGIASSGGSGDAMRLLNSPSSLTEMFTSGVFGDAINGVLENAQTSKVTDYNKLNVEPENITTVYIMRVK